MSRLARLLPLALLLSLPAGLLGQSPVAWWTNPVANGLDLTDEQKGEISTIAEEYRERISLKSDETERAERALERIFNADTVDWQRGEQAITQLVRVRGELTQEISRMTLRMRAILSPQQWRTLQARTGGRAAGIGPGEGRGRGPGPGSGPGRGREKGRGRGRPNPDGGTSSTSEAR